MICDENFDFMDHLQLKQDLLKKYESIRCPIIMKLIH